MWACETPTLFRGLGCHSSISSLTVDLNLSEYSVCYAHLNMMLHVNLLLGVQRATTIQQTAASVNYHMLWTTYEVKILSSFIIFIEYSQMLWFFPVLESKGLDPEIQCISQTGSGYKSFDKPNNLSPKPVPPHLLMEKTAVLKPFFACEPLWAEHI